MVHGTKFFWWWRWGWSRDNTLQGYTQNLIFGKFTAGYGTGFLAILQENKRRTNLALDDLKDCQNKAYSVTCLVTGNRQVDKMDQTCKILYNTRNKKSRPFQPAMK